MASPLRSSSTCGFKPHKISLQLWPSACMSPCCDLLWPLTLLFPKDTAQLSSTVSLSPEDMRSPLQSPVGLTASYLHGYQTCHCFLCIPLELPTSIFLGTGKGEQAPSQPRSMVESTHPLGYLSRYAGWRGGKCLATFGMGRNAWSVLGQHVR